MTDLFDDAALAIVRRAYARQMLAAAGVMDDPALEEAFAAVPRERFLGPPPWRMVVFHGAANYRDLPADPVLVYQDINLALAPERGVNNGSPLLHARWLHAAGLKRGERAVHVGIGGGYYTALMAEMAGPDGHVLAVEYDAALAGMARDHLAVYDNVAVIQGDGAAWPREPVDVVYVNALVGQPAAAWFENLRPGGRIVFPLGVPRPNRSGGGQTLYGAGLRLEKRERDFAVGWLGPAFFVCAEGELASSPEQAEALKAAFERGGVEFVKSLRWNRPADTGRCWHVGAGWSLGYDEAV